MDKIKGIEKLMILLVDDDENYLKITQLYLQDNGLKVMAYQDARSALELCKNEKIDIILLDYFMPQMTGEVFVKELRKTNNKSLVILQTGFAEKKPPIELLTNLDIQGYYDKTKDIDELLLMVLSAAKTINLMDVNQQQEQSIDILTYKKQFLGSLILGLVTEAENQLLTIDSAKENFSLKSSAFKNETNMIDRANRKLRELFRTINFESVKIASCGDLINMLNILLKDMRNNKEFKVNYDVDLEDMKKIVFSGGIDTIIYATVETINYFISKDIKEATISFDQDENRAYLKILTPDIKFSKDFIDVIKLIAYSNKKAGISIYNDVITISIQKVFE